MAFRHVARSYATSQTLYEILELPPGASIQEIKRQFKNLSKKYHPDLNSHLGAAAREQNQQKYVDMVSAYDTLKDAAKKKDYDATLAPGRPSTRKQWENEYYGEAKYHSRGRASAHNSSGYSYGRHRVHNFYTGEGPKTSHFSGSHRSHGDRYDVPHFDYNEHLAKLLKFEQRIINKRLSDADREAIVRQLAPDGDLSKVNAEIYTKLLMRQARTSHVRHHVRSHSGTTNPHMYQSPNETSFGVTAALIAGGAGSVYLLYQALA